MFKSVLIANRGEIACRIGRTAKRLGLRTIAVYSQADTQALHVRHCDEAHRIGRAPAAESYLRIEKLIAVARAAGAECIHPGYGFLSENPEFAQACIDAGIVFLGPSPQAIRAMGLKDRAKSLMEKAGVPVVPGYHGDLQEPKFLARKAYEIGYPVLIKAVAGGGGKGMRRVERHADFEAALAGAQREAKAAFGDERVLVEKYINAPRHIEMQVLADRHGDVIHLNERDCSLQRRHQKVIEEAPALGMTAQLRAEMGAAAVAAAQAAGDGGAGTIEFIADGAGGLKAGGFWFMEMNTRLQVEHPVTEAITGLDLVEWQFRVAAGEALPLAQDQVPLAGHSVEARLYAEDPERNFLPSTGKLLALQFPEQQGLRIDAGVEAGSEVTPFYDPLIAKLIVHGDSRGEALDRLSAVLEQTIAIGPRTNAGFLARLCRAPGFRTGAFDTGFIDSHMADLAPPRHGFDAAAVALGAQTLLQREVSRIESISRDTEQPPSPWDSGDAFQLAEVRRLMLPLLAEGRHAVAEVVYGPAGPLVTVEGKPPVVGAVAIAAGEAVYVLRDGRQTRVTLRDHALDEGGDQDSGGLVRAPMHGKVLAVLVAAGERVTRGQRLAIIEAMKMEHTLHAPFDGTVTEIAVAAEAQVADGAKVMLIAADVPPGSNGNGGG